MSKTTRCKFTVDSVTTCKTEGCRKTTKAILGPRYSDDPNSENRAFWEATPSGHLEISVTNGSLDDMQPGDEYYIDLTKASSE